MVRERPLPGVYFETYTPEPSTVLPRMDIAAFVGFSEKGPLHKPEIIEDPEQFTSMYGGEVALAWDPERQETVYAHLPRTVRTFFENGGRRCHVIRVGGAEALLNFGSNLFLDKDLKDARADDLLTTAFYLRYQSPKPREQLQGIHAALELEDVTLIAVPDAVHRRATLRDETLKTVVFTEKPPKLEQKEAFEDCKPLLLAPQLTTNPSESKRDSFDYPEGTEFVLEESRSADFKKATVVYRGVAQNTAWVTRNYGRNENLFYRARAEHEAQSLVSDWSETISVLVNPLINLELESLDSFQSGTLLEIQRGLLHLCAARGDLFALLSLPEHFREAETLPPDSKKCTSESAAQSYFCQLRNKVEENGGYRSLSYGAIYHPWPIYRVSETNDPSSNYRTVPPDGVVTGLLARRALARGAWTPPANELFKGMVALSPRISSENYAQWYEAQINLLRHEAKGFLTLSSETLADIEKQDLELRSINVRRLLILLRRMALRLGNELVFEPNNEALRRRVERTFETALDYLFERGAFRPERRNDAYRVVTDSSLNTPQSVDLGRFIVEIKVAPSQPLAFLTVRLVQTGDRGLVVQEA